MFKVGMTRRAQHCLLAAFILFGLNAHASGQQNEPSRADGIRTEIVVSDGKILPFESLSVLLLLRNYSREARRIVAARYSIVEVGETTPRGIKWRVYDEAYNPNGPTSLPYEMVLPPDYLNDYLFNINFHDTGEHAFARPGSYKVKGHLGSLDSLGSEAKDITVQQPAGADAKAYKFLKASEARKFLTEHTVANFTYTLQTERAMEKFIARAGSSKYGDLARIGLALMCLKGVEAKRDLPKAIALLTRVTEKAKEPLASRANYYLGLCALEQEIETKAREYFQKSLHGKPDPFFRYLSEQALADQGFGNTRSLHHSLLRPHNRKPSV